MIDALTHTVLGVLAQKAPPPPDNGPIINWLSDAADYFIGLFRAGGDVFSDLVTGIVPLLIVLLTAVYAVINLVGEQRIHGAARWAGKTAFTRYTILPILAMFFLTNPMAYTFGTFLEERHKPAFYDSAVSFCHPITGLFPHANAAELFVYLGVARGLQKQDLSLGPIAVRYFAAGVVVILLRGIVTERITMLLAKRSNIELERA